MRYVVATCLISTTWAPRQAPTAWYLVIERTTNVSSDWKIRFGTDNKDIATRECSRLNDDENRERLQEREQT